MVRSRRSKRGRKAWRYWAPRSDISIVNRLADNLRDGGRVANPYGADAIVDPGLRSHFVRV